MIELFYDAFTIAYFMVCNDMGCCKQLEILDHIYQEEYNYIHPCYRGQQKRLVSDVLYWTDYLIDKEIIDSEFPVIKRDFDALGKTIVKEKVVSEFPEIDTFFMFMRLNMQC